MGVSEDDMLQIRDDNGVWWHKVMTTVARQHFQNGSVVLIADVDKNARIVNSNWIKVRYARQEQWYGAHLFESPRFGHACHYVKDRLSGEGSKMHTFIEAK